MLRRSELWHCVGGDVVLGSGPRFELERTSSSSRSRMAGIAPAGSETSMIRSVLAVVAGYLVVATATFLTFVLAGDGLRRAPDPALLANPNLARQLLCLAASAAYCIAGGYVAAALAPDSPRRHALSLGVSVAALAFVSLASGRAREPLWFQILLLFLAIPAAVAGGWLRDVSRSRTRAEDRQV
jgi:hypothetical protein